jgi:N-acetylated-alpha-linked acidic dipeptidase
MRIPTAVLVVVFVVVFAFAQSTPSSSGAPGTQSSPAPATAPAVQSTPAPASSAPQSSAPSGAPTGAQDPNSIFGFRDSAAERNWEQQFMAVPDPKLAEEHLRILTSAPHIASSPEDRKTAEYVAQKYREAGLDTEIVEYKIWMPLPKEVTVDVTAPAGVKMHGPEREHVDGDPFDNDPRVVMPYNGYSPSGDAEAEVVYANYGRLEDIEALKKLGIDVKGKILLVRYGANFRGVKSFVAQQFGAAGVIIYSDPIDDGWFKGDKYPNGPWRPDTGVQRGSIAFMFEYSGDPTTPGIASVPNLPDSQRTNPQTAAAMPRVITLPISYKDAWPILQNMTGPDSPREWQGALPFTYHVGPGPVRVKMHVNMDYAYRTIWDVIGKLKGSQLPNEWVVAGNHRDAWVYGAVDPNSGTAAQLEAVHGIGVLLKAGWKPKRTMVFASWDAEEQGLMGSTEWAEQNERALANAAAYFNMDVGASGPNFGASAVPSLKQFIRDVSRAVPAHSGGTVYDAWVANEKKKEEANRSMATEAIGGDRRKPQARVKNDVPVGDLGSGSDYTPFLQHLAVPSNDIGSSGPYGVYHSVFDNFNWYKKFGDPDFKITQQMARIYGLQMIRMSTADVLPLDYEEYGKEVENYFTQAQAKADGKFGAGKIDFAPAIAAARRFTSAGASALTVERSAPANATSLNRALSQAERALIVPEGLPHRPWYKHAIYAPGEYTGYAAVVIPGVNEAIDKNDLNTAQQQLRVVTDAVNRAAQVLESVSRMAASAGQ